MDREADRQIIDSCLWMDRGIDKSMDGWIDRSMDRWIVGWIDRSKDG